MRCLRIIPALTSAFFYLTIALAGAFLPISQGHYLCPLLALAQSVLSSLPVAVVSWLWQIGCSELAVVSQLRQVGCDELSHSDSQVSVMGRKIIGACFLIMYGRSKEAEESISLGL